MVDPLQSAVDALAEELRRSVVLDDPAVRLLVTSRHFGDEDDVRVRAVLQRDAGPEVAGHVLAQGVASWVRPGVIAPRADLGMHARVCVPTRWRGEVLGLLMVMDADGTLTTGELTRIGDVADELAAILAARSPEVGEVREETVLDLLGADEARRRRAVAELASVVTPEGTSSRSLEAVAIAVDAGEASAHADAALRSVLLRLGPDAGEHRICAVREGTGRLVVCAPRAPDPGRLRALAARLVAAVDALGAGRLHCAAGIGEVVEGLAAAHVSAEQARLAARAVPGVVEGPVAAFGDLGAHAALLQIARPEEALLPRELRVLRAVDEDGELVRTVAAFLDHAGSGPAAAAALHVHRTTLYYRLRRVTELTGLDLGDGSTRLALHVGLALLRLTSTSGQRADGSTDGAT